MALYEVPPLTYAILLSSLMIFLFIALCLDKTKLLEFYEMISNPKIFSCMCYSPEEILSTLNDLDTERWGTSANTSKHLDAEVYIHHVLATQTIISPGSRKMLCIEHFWIHLLIPTEYFFT